jgi:hypothetical protein
VIWPISEPRPISEDRGGSGKIEPGVDRARFLGTHFLGRLNIAKLIPPIGPPHHPVALIICQFVPLCQL